MRGVAFVTAGVVVGGCSLFTDLGGLEDPPPSTIIVQAEGGTTDGDTSSPRDAGGTVDAPGTDAPPANIRYARTLTLMGDATAATIDAGSTHCIRLGPEVIATAITQKKMRPDLGDLRIYGTTGPLDIVVDPLAVGRAEVCFKLEHSIGSGVSDTYELRYGDPSATQPSISRGSFFSFYEGFGGTTVDTSKWQVWGAPVVTGQRLELRKGAESGITTTSTTDGVPASTSLEIKVEVPNPGSELVTNEAGAQFYYWFGFQRYGDFTALEPWAVFIERLKLTINAEQKNESGTCLNICQQPYNIQTADKRIYRIDRHAAGTVFAYDDDTKYTTTQAAGDLSIMIRSYLKDSDLYVYWVRARPLVFPEPTLTIGDEKTL
jgi:hypothetical protein